MSASDSEQSESSETAGAKRSGKRPRRSKSGKNSAGSPAFDHRPASGRHQARILALQVLYEIDVTDHPLVWVLARTTEDPDEAVTPAVRTHVDRLVRGALSQRDVIDRFIGDAAPAFPVNQLPAVDRNVLRLAIYELLCEPEVPHKAAINEAVELAKRFGGMNSSRFVNGVLGTVTDRLAENAPGESAATTDSDSATPESD